MDMTKEAVRKFWNGASCGENLYLSGRSRADFETHSRVRYEIEPYIKEFADFGNYKGKKVLEIGVGLGADHQKFAEAGASLHGVDLTERAIQNTKKRFELFSLRSELKVADAENLPFEDKSFDLVYSWGVLHYSSDTGRAIDEVYRILRDGGEAKVMIYHKWSLVGYMLWIRYALLRLKPTMSLRQVYKQYLESPNANAYSIDEARNLFRKFKNVEIDTVLTHVDLLTSDVGQLHRGAVLTIARYIWPRWAIKRCFKKHGLFMLIKAKR